MTAIGLADRRQGAQIVPEVVAVAIGQPTVGWVRENREIKTAVGPPAVTHGAHEIIPAPSAQPGFRVSSDVWAVINTERGLQRFLAGPKRAPFDTVAMLTTGDREQASTAFGIGQSTGRRRDT